MKKLILIFTLPFILKSFGQNPIGNRAFQASSDFYNIDMTEWNGNYYIMGAPFYIYSVTKTGNYRFGRSFSGMAYTDMKSVNNKIILAAETYPCDYGNFNGYIQGMDTLGNTTFTVSLPNNSSPKLAIYPNHDIYVFTSADTLYRLTENGNLVYKMPLGYDTVSSVCLLPNGNFLASVIQSGSNYLVDIDTTGFGYEEQTIPYSFKKITPVFALSSAGFITKIDTTSLQVVATSQLAQGSNTITDFDIRQDTIYACGNDGSNHLVYLKFDTTLQIQYQFISTFPSIKPAQISATNNQISFSSMEQANSNTNVDISFTSITGNTGFSYPDEASIINLSASSYIYYDQYSGMPSNEYEEDLYYKFNVTVKNLGTDTLHSIYINHRPNIPPGFGCGIYYYSKYFNSLNLAPNDTIILTTDWIEAYVHDIYSYPDTTIAITQNLCVWTSLPNNKSDNYHSNDYYCGNIIFNHSVIATGITELFSNNPQFSVYPNPANSVIHIAINNKQIQEIKITDVLGNEALQSKQSSIDVSNLSNGVYFIQVKTYEGISTKKIMVQH